MTESEVAKDGDKVKIHYTGTLDDKSVFDSSEGKDPLEFTIGSKQVIPGFESAVKGMKVGEEKDVHIISKEAYGEPNPQLIQEVPKAQMPQGDVKVGMVLVMSLPNGQQIPATIVEVTDDKVKLDINHPLAGKDLNFKIKLVEIVK